MIALVSGSAGFVGRHMTAALEAAGWAVSTQDIADGADVCDYFREATRRYDLVVHAAAVGAHRAAIDATPLALAENLELDAAMFGWAARVKPGRVVYLSSSAAYPVQFQGGSRPADLHENDIDPHRPLLPDGIYGWIKLTGERLAAHARTAGVPVTVVRPFSGYGEDQDARFPFGRFLARVREREDPFTIWGTGRQVRDFIHVDDICAAILTMVREGIDGPVNLGTGRGTSMLELARMMCDAAGYDPEFRPLPGKPSGVGYRVADTTRMREFCAPRVSLEEGVARSLAVTAGKR